jgi:hypothetical protein
MSHALADRHALRQHSRRAVDAICRAQPPPMVTRFALERTSRLIYVDNQPVPIEGSIEERDGLAVAELA